jgi:3-isopropylmalate dehydrogenase
MNQKQFKVAVLGGDGIGPEVTSATVEVLKKIETGLTGVSFAFDEYQVGVGEYLRSKIALPDATFEACKSSDAVLLGAMGMPSVRYPDGTEIAPQLELRERLQLYGGVRPIHLFHPDDSPLKNYGPGEIDFVLVRESTEGLFSGRDATFADDATEATNVMRITRHGAERVSRLAFEVARKRNKKKHVTLIDKANVLSAMVFMREVFDEVAKEFPDCTSDHCYVDAAALFMVRDPKRFDVMVTENMFGDILSDLAAGLVGGMGMAPSGDIGVDAAVFQPSHGSAPDIAGQGIANPIATLLSAAMMLEWFDHEQTISGAKTLRQAIGKVLSNPENRTPDMGGKMKTQQITQSILQAIELG